MEKFIEDATKAYIIAYNTAMEMTHNANMAMNVAACVVMSFMQITKPQEQEINPMAAVMAAVGQILTKQNEEEQEETNNDTRDM